MARAVRLVGVGVLAALLIADLLLVVVLVVGIVGSLTGSDDYDPHGYLPIFGVVALLFLVPVGATLPANICRES